MGALVLLRERHHESLHSDAYARRPAGPADFDANADPDPRAVPHARAPFSVKITHVIPGTEGAHVAIQWSPSRPTDVSNLTLEWETVNKDCRYLLVVPVVCKGSAELAYNGAAWVVDGKFKPGTPYHKFKIKAEVDSGKIEGWFKDANGNHEVVTTHPRPVIEVVRVYGEKATSPKFEDVDRSLFTYFTVKLVVPDAVRNAASSAQYKVVMSAPAGTGLQAKKSRLESCSYGSQPSAPWNRLNDPAAEFHLVRCSLGDGDTDMTLYATVARGGNEYNVGTYARVAKVPQSLHRADNSVTYHVRGTSGDTINDIETAEQEGMFLTPPSDPDFKMPTSTALYDLAVYAKAAAVWNGVGAGVTISRGTKKPFVVEIRGYWIDDAKCPQTIACVWPKNKGSHEGEGQTMWIENPPKLYRETKVRVWTNDFARWVSRNKTYQYLPALLVHEFGHPLGLANSNERLSIMNQGIHDPCGPDIAKCLTDADKKGLKAVYKSHNKH